MQPPARECFRAQLTLPRQKEEQLMSRLLYLVHTVTFIKQHVSPDVLRVYYMGTSYF
jgi:hypothetical protein